MATSEDGGDVHDHVATTEMTTLESGPESYSTVTEAAAVRGESPAVRMAPTVGGGPRAGGRRHHVDVLCVPVCLRHFSDASPSTARTRAYQLWPGKNVFFLRGHIICGPDPRGFLLTAISVALSTWIFCVYVGHDLPDDSAPLIITSALILAVTVLVNLMLVGTTDPGIIPRRDQPPLPPPPAAAPQEEEEEEEEVGTSYNINRTRSRRICVNGIEVKLKYCRACMLFRPPRSCHCAICDNCVERFDHHCPWIGQCIGLRNYRFYIMFVSSALVFFVYVFAFSWRRIGRLMSKPGSAIFKQLVNSPETLALASFSFVSIWFLGGLAAFHAYLITRNETARENFKRRYKDSPNPYDKGILGNIKEALFARLPPSKVNFRAEVDPQYCCSRSRVHEKAAEVGDEAVTVAWKCSGSELPRAQMSESCCDRGHLEEVKLEISTGELQEPQTSERM